MSQDNQTASLRPIKKGLSQNRKLHSLFSIKTRDKELDSQGVRLFSCLSVFLGQTTPREEMRNER